MKILYVALYIVAFFILLLIVYRYVVKSTLASSKYNKPEKSIVHQALINKEFDVYLINLSHNKDRLQHFSNLYKKSDLNFQPFIRFEAVNGKLLDIQPLVTAKAFKEIDEAEKTGFRTKHYQLSRGGIGCYISHMNIYRMVADGKKPFAIIFEDDVVFPPNILSMLKYETQNIPNNWDIILLGCHCIICEKYERFSVTNRFFWLHGYLIRKEGAQKLLAYLDNRPIEQQIDTVLSVMASKKLLNIYCINKAIARQSKGFRTTIQIPMKNEKGIDPYAL